jgi:AraC-like DNA-binding protein
MKRHFSINYYKNASQGMHVQKISNSVLAQEEHSHEYFQIYYVAHGTITHVTKKGESRLTKGDTFIIPPNQIHKICNLNGSVFYTFSFTGESIEQALVPHSFVKQFLTDISKNVAKAKISLSDDEILFVEQIMEKLYQEFNLKQAGFLEVMRSYATAILTMLARRSYQNVPSSQFASDVRTSILYCIDYVKKNFSLELSLDEMTKLTAMSKTDFCRHFRSISGVTFNRFLHLTRINNAVNFIKSGYKLSLVGNLCGYNDFSTFYRNFKKIIGCSPIQYRQSTKTQQR